MNLTRLNLAETIILLLTTFCLIQDVIPTTSPNSPLIYTRLRFDQNYLPLMKNLQLKFPYDEDKFQATIVAHENNNTTVSKTQNMTYYINSRVNLNNITEDDLILDALDQVYKSRLYQVYIQSYDRLEDRLISSDSNKVSIDECKRDLNYIMDKFQYMINLKRNQGSGGFRGLNPELATYFDSFGSEEAGLLLGNNNWLGNWRQCSRRHIFDLDQKQMLHMLQSNNNNNHSSQSSLSQNNEKESSIKVTNFRGRFCIAAIRSPHWKQKIIQRADELTKNYFKYPTQHHEYVNFFRIQVGICLPESCDSSTIDFRSQDLRKLTMHKLREPFTSYELFDFYCLPDESSKLRQVDSSGTILIGVLISWLTLIGLATCCDYYKLVDLSETKQDKNKKRSAIQKVVFSMSLRENYQRLTKKSAPETTSTIHKFEVKGSDLRFLDGFKVIIMPSIILAHVGMIGLQFSKQPIDFDSAPTILFAIQSGSAFYVDWYFCLSGFITTYVMFSKNKLLTYNLSRWLYTIFHRYWRLAPSYIIFFWFCRSLYSLTNSGPLWDYGTTDLNGPRSLCQHESWLIPFTLTSNWHPLHRECVMPSWYISCDMQFYLITPMLLVLLAKSPISGWLMAISLILGSLIARFHIYLTDIHIESLDLLRPRADVVMRHSWDVPEVYLRPHYRIPSYLIGILFGHYNYMVKSGRWKSPLYKRCRCSLGTTTRSNSNGINGVNNDNNICKNCLKTNGSSWQLRMCAWIGLCMGISFKLSALSLNYFYPTSLEYQAKIFAAILFSSAHAAAVLSPCLIFTAILFGYWQQVRKILELPICTYTARVNYFVYLCQIDVLIWFISSSVQPLDINGQEQFRLFTYSLPWIYFGAFLATLLLSNPLNTLETEFLGVYFEDEEDDHDNHSQFDDSSGRNIIRESTNEELKPLERIIIIENGTEKVARGSVVESLASSESRRHQSNVMSEQQHKEMEKNKATSGTYESTGAQFSAMIVTSSDEPLQATTIPAK